MIWFLKYICGRNIHFGGLMVATLKLRDSFGKLLTDDCLGANIKVKLPFFATFSELTDYLTYQISLWNHSRKKSWQIFSLIFNSPVQIKPVEGFCFTERVDGQLHQLVVAQVQWAQGGWYWPGWERFAILFETASKLTRKGHRRWSLSCCSWIWGTQQCQTWYGPPGEEIYKNKYKYKYIYKLNYKCKYKYINSPVSNRNYFHSWPTSSTSRPASTTSMWVK